MAVVQLVDRDQGYHEEVVMLLKGLLVAAEAGEVLSLAYACERPGDVVTFGSTRFKNRYNLLGFLDHMKWLINQSLDSEATDSDLLEMS